VKNSSSGKLSGTLRQLASVAATRTGRGGKSQLSRGAPAAAPPPQPPSLLKPADFDPFAGGDSSSDDGGGGWGAAAAHAAAAAAGGAAKFDPFAGGEPENAEAEAAAAVSDDGEFDPFAGGAPATPRATPSERRSGGSADDAFDPFGGGAGGDDGDDAAAAAAPAPAPAPKKSMRQQLEDLRLKKADVKAYSDSDFLDTDEVFRRKNAGSLTAARKQAPRLHAQIDEIIRAMLAGRCDAAAEEAVVALGLQEPTAAEAAGIRMERSEVRVAADAAVPWQRVVWALNTMARAVPSKDARASAICHPLFLDLSRLAHDCVHELDARGCSDVMRVCAKLYHRDHLLLDPLVARFVTLLPQADAHDISYMIHGLGKLNIRPKRAQIEAIIDDIPRKLPQFAPEHVANCIWAFALLTKRYGGVLDELAGHAAKHIDGFDAAHLASMTWALAKMRHVHTALMEALPDACVCRAAEFTSGQLADVLQSFALLNAKPGGACLTALAEASIACVGEFSPHHLTTVVWAFATIEHVLSEEQMAGLEVGVLEALPRFAASHLVAMISAFAATTNAPMALMEELNTHAAEHAGEYKPSEVSRLVCAYSRLGVKADWLRGEAHSAKAAATAGGGAGGAESVDLSKLALSEVVAFLKASAMKKAHPGDILDQIALEIVHRSFELTPPEISSLVWAFATFGMRDTALLEATAREMCNQLALFRPCDVANTLWGFGILNFFSPRAMALAEEQELARLAEYTPGQLTNVAWAFAKLHRAPAAVIDAISASVLTRDFGDFKPSHVSTLAWVHGRIETPTPNNAFMVQLGGLVLESQSLKVFAAPELVDLVWGFTKILRGQSKRTEHHEELEKIALRMGAEAATVLLAEGSIEMLGGQELADLVWTFSFLTLRGFHCPRQLLWLCAAAAFEHVMVFRAPALSSVICAFSVFADDTELAGCHSFHAGLPLVERFMTEMFVARPDAVRELSPSAYCNLLNAMNTLRFCPIGFMPHEAELLKAQEVDPHARARATTKADKATRMMMGKLEARFLNLSGKFNSRQLVVVGYWWLMMSCDMSETFVATWLRRVCEANLRQLSIEMLARLCWVLHSIQAPLRTTAGALLWKQVFQSIDKLFSTRGMRTHHWRSPDARLVELASQPFAADVLAAGSVACAPARNMMCEQLENTCKGSWINKERSRLEVKAGMPSHAAERTKSRAAAAADVGRILEAMSVPFKVSGRELAADCPAP
jgi:hypothetical protein